MAIGSLLKLDAFVEQDPTVTYWVSAFSAAVVAQSMPSSSTKLLLNCLPFIWTDECLGWSCKAGARRRQGKCQVCSFLFSLVLDRPGFWLDLTVHRVCLDQGLFETKSHCSTKAVAMELMDCSRKIWCKFEEWFFSGEGKRCAAYVSSGGLNVWR